MPGHAGVDSCRPTIEPAVLAYDFGAAQPWLVVPPSGCERERVAVARVSWPVKWSPIPRSWVGRPMPPGNQPTAASVGSTAINRPEAASIRTTEPRIVVTTKVSLSIPTIPAHGSSVAGHSASHCRRKSPSRQ